MQVDFKNSPKILNEYYTYLNSTKNYSIDTIKYYYSSILYFFIFLKQYKDIAIEIKDFDIFIILGIKEADIEAFITFLNNDRNNNSKTRNARLASLKAFYNYIFRKYETYCADKINPAKYIAYANTISKLPKHLNLKQAKTLCNIFNKDNCTSYIRNNLIIYLFLNLGLRKSELVSLNINNINFNDNTITVVGKGNKERTLYINNTIKEHILEYLNTRQEISLDSFEPLFTTKENKRVSNSTIRYIVEKAYILANLDNRNYNVHSLRHTAASILYKSTNGDLLVVKNILGHSSIKSTQIYTHIENKEVKKAFYSNPLANYETNNRREGD